MSVAKFSALHEIEDTVSVYWWMVSTVARLAMRSIGKIHDGVNYFYMIVSWTNQGRFGDDDVAKNFLLRGRYPTRNLGRGHSGVWIQIYLLFLVTVTKKK